MKEFKLLDGSIVETAEKCRGCFLINSQISDYLNPIFENEYIIIRQDMEFPIPAFYIISTKKHISSYEEMNKVLRGEVSEAIYLLRKALKEELGIKRVTIIQEEKDNSSHFHIWMLPVWEDVTKERKINPRVIENNLLDYMNSFSFEKNSKDILKCNDRMKIYLGNKIYKQSQ